MSDTITRSLTAQDLADTFDAFNRHDIEGVMRHFADDAVFYTVGGEKAHGTRIEGRDAHRRRLRRGVDGDARRALGPPGATSSTATARSRSGPSRAPTRRACGPRPRAPTSSPSATAVSP